MTLLYLITAIFTMLSLILSVRRRFGGWGRPPATSCKNAAFRSADAPKCFFRAKYRRSSFSSNIKSDLIRR